MKLLRAPPRPTRPPYTRTVHAHATVRVYGGVGVVVGSRDAVALAADWCGRLGRSGLCALGERPLPASLEYSALREKFNPTRKPSRARARRDGRGTGLTPVGAARPVRRSAGCPRHRGMQPVCVITIFRFYAIRRAFIRCKMYSLMRAASFGLSSKQMGTVAHTALLTTPPNRSQTRR